MPLASPTKPRDKTRSKPRAQTAPRSGRESADVIATKRAAIKAQLEKENVIDFSDMDICFGREELVHRFHDFFKEMLPFITPEMHANFVQVGTRKIHMYCTPQSVHIALIDDTTGAVCQYFLNGDVSDPAIPLYAQYIESTLVTEIASEQRDYSGKNLFGKRGGMVYTNGRHDKVIYSFNAKEGQCCCMDMKNGGRREIIPVPRGLFDRISFFENTVRGMLWKKKS